jgi:transposase
MKKDSVKGGIKVLGIDLAKQSFQLHGVDAVDQQVVRKPLSRTKLSAYVAQLPPCLIGMEACGGAHHWVRVLQRVWTYGAAAGPAVRQALCQIE